jgi:hypothetical protein
VTVLDRDMRNIIECARLAFVAIIGIDGEITPAGRGMVKVHDDTHLVFTGFDATPAVVDLTSRSRLGFAVVDAVRRRGYRFAGPAERHDPGSDVSKRPHQRLRDGNLRRQPVNPSLRIRVDYAQPVWSPAFSQRRADEYDLFGRLSVAHFDDRQRDASSQVAIA